MQATLVISGSLCCPVGWSAAEHSHPHSELLLVAEGAMTAVVDDHELTATAGDILLYPPGARHRERNAGRRRLDLLFVHGGFQAGTGPRLADRRGRLASLVRWLVEDQAAGAPGTALSAWMAALREQLGRCAAEASGGVASAARAHMRAHLGQAHGVAGLAHAAGLGPRQFLRRYRAETGAAPMADLRRLRCEAAAELLVTEGWPLERVARAVGFCDAFHLSKVFRAHFGVPPGRMRSRPRR